MQVLIYGIYTCACWALLSDELPSEDGAAADAHFFVKQAAQDGPLSAGSTPRPGPAAAHGGLGSASPKRLLARREAAYLAGLPALEVFGAVVHPLLLRRRLPFLPLLLTSVYCACGMSWAWWRMARHYLGGAPRTKAE